MQVVDNIIYPKTPDRMIDREKKKYTCAFCMDLQNKSKKWKIKARQVQKWIDTQT